MTRVALLTTGVMVGRETDPRMQGFFDRIDAAFAAAAASPGFCAAAGYDEDNPWHINARPALFAEEEYAGRVTDTLSVWESLEQVFAFAYSGIHAEAMSKRKEWLIDGDWPSYVAWWVDDDHMPTWEEGYARHALLQRNGATPAAFTFKQPFDAGGRPYRFDRQAALRTSGQHPDEEKRDQ
jgi:hypothetical protein